MTDASPAIETSELLKRATSALQDLFGLPGFRKPQEPIIEAVLRNENLLVVMPTGAGKSLIYQLPALVRRGLTLVVSPLIALMKDQVDQLTGRGLGEYVATINSSIDFEQQVQIMDRVATGEIRLLYVSPERFQNRGFMDRLRDVQVRMLAVDEAHCISQWGHDFRPDYTRLGQVCEQLQPRQILAATATATEKVRADIANQLGQDLHTIVAGFKRDNLYFEVRRASRKVEKIKAIEQTYRQMGKYGIVYCSTRRNVENISEALLDAGIRVTAYHGGMMDDERRRNQERFQDGDADVIVATNAFGMGVDKPDVRFIIHYDIPGSVEAYYQEAGRAGRDGEPSQCSLLYSPHDLRVQETFLEGENPTPDAIREVWDKLLAVPGDVIEQTRAEMAEGLTSVTSEYAVSTVIKHLVRAGYIKRIYDHQAKAAFRLTGYTSAKRGTKARLYEFLGQQPGARDGGVAFDLDELARQFEVTHETLRNAIRQLEEGKVIQYEPPFRGRAVQITQRVEADELELDWDFLEAKRKAAHERLDQMKQYAEFPVCRHVALVRYFGQELDDCGTSCDVCRGLVGYTRRSRSGDTTAVPKSQPLPTELSPRAANVAFDVLRLAKKLNGVFGSRRLAQILVGSEQAQIKDWNLDRHAEYARYSELSLDALNDAVDALIGCGLLELYRKNEGDKFKRCRISERGEECVARQADSMLPVVPALLMLDTAAAAAQAMQSDSGGGGDDDEGDYDKVLYEKLRDLRRQLAKRDSVPPYRVGNNSTLKGLAAARPRSHDGLLAVKGVGEAIASQYGGDILQVIETHLVEVDGAEPNPSVPAPGSRGGSTPRAESRSSSTAKKKGKTERKRKKGKEQRGTGDALDGLVDATVRAALEREASQREAARRKAAKPAPPPVDGPPTLYDELRALRKTIAERDNIEPWRVGTNPMLRAIADAEPKTVADLRAMDAVDADIVHQFGPELVDCVRGFTGSSGTDEQQPPPSDEPAPAPGARSEPDSPAPERTAPDADTPVVIRESISEPPPPKPKSKSEPKPLKPPPAAPEPSSDGRTELFNRLREFRDRASGITGLPIHRIATDAALRAIALAAPTKPERLAAIEGVSPITIRDYGEAIVEVVRRYRAHEAPDPDAAIARLPHVSTQREEARRPADAPPPAERQSAGSQPAADPATPDRADELGDRVLALLTFGRSPAEVARATSMPLPAVIEVIEFLLSAGCRVDAPVLFDGPLLDAALEFSRPGASVPSAEDLAERLPETTPAEIRLLHAWLKHRV